MEAMRLIDATRLALTQATAVQDIVAEAWQAQALAEVIGDYFAGSASPAARWEAEGLSEAGGRACGALNRPALSHPALRTGAIRAMQLTEVRDPRRVLLALGVLLGEVGIALVEVACVAEEGLYWQCVEAVDAADESRDRIFGMLRELSIRQEGGAA
ncbi:DUF6099 family protein [Streptomyces zagrosensis]|uniref:Uncharacterized protein n=1 Tax=Streptomyces zagrosensis TaxID=1042984 RepID=A0A7W9V233_9ACTN|nr:DUF6099 family protein [Streptomyces zagrosensis]MBB5939918.1 hypothetical protein [Streptomyces zagrosensis]